MQAVVESSLCIYRIGEIKGKRLWRWSSFTSWTENTWTVKEPNTSLIMRCSVICHVFRLPNTSAILPCVMYFGCPTPVWSCAICHVSCIQVAQHQFDCIQDAQHQFDHALFRQMSCIQVFQHQLEHALFRHVSCIQVAQRQFVHTLFCHVSLLQVAQHQLNFIQDAANP